MLLKDQRIRNHYSLDGRLAASREFYEAWGDVLGRTFKKWWNETGSALFIQKQYVEPLTSQNVAKFNLDDPRTFALVIKVESSPSQIAKKVKWMYRKRYDEVMGTSGTKQRRRIRLGTEYKIRDKAKIRTGVYRVNMKWFQDVYLNSDFSLKGNALIVSTAEWFQKNAAWVKKLNYPITQWEGSAEGKMLNIQRTYTFRLQKFMKEAFQRVASGKF
jgi:hypothetical protein